MRDLRLNGIAQRFRVAPVVFALVLGIAAPAGAGNVLFQIEVFGCSFRRPDCSPEYPKAIGTVSGPTLMTTPTVSGGADFTIHSRISVRSDLRSDETFPRRGCDIGVYEVLIDERTCPARRPHTRHHAAALVVSGIRGLEVGIDGWV